MIKYTLKVGDEVATLECETMDELLQYLKADKSEVVNVVNVVNKNDGEKTDCYAKAWKEREALTKINNAPNYID